LPRVKGKEVPVPQKVGERGEATEHVAEKIGVLRGPFAEKSADGMGRGGKSKLVEPTEPPLAQIWANGGKPPGSGNLPEPEKRSKIFCPFFSATLSGATPLSSDKLSEDIFCPFFLAIPFPISPSARGPPEKIRRTLFHPFPAVDGGVPDRLYSVQ
jgi:hypothetical protein